MNKLTCPDLICPMSAAYNLIVEGTQWSVSKTRKKLLETIKSDFNWFSVSNKKFILHAWRFSGLLTPWKKKVSWPWFKFRSLHSSVHKSSASVISICEKKFRSGYASLREISEYSVKNYWIGMILWAVRFMLNHRIQAGFEYLMFSTKKSLENVICYVFATGKATNLI